MDTRLLVISTVLLVLNLNCGNILYYDEEVRMDEVRNQNQTIVNECLEKKPGGI